jgi:hypothetical protein
VGFTLPTAPQWLLTGMAILVSGHYITAKVERRETGTVSAPQWDIG